MRRLLRAPGLHFLVLGGLLFAASAWLEARTDRAPGAGRIALTAAQVEQLRRTWAEAHGALPSPDTEATLVRDAIDEEVLHREALARGLDRHDPLVQERLARLGGFLGLVGERDDGSFEREVRRLGLSESDVVIRRHLVQLMRLALARLDARERPSEAEVTAYYAGHPDLFAEPARLRLTHVYLARDLHRQTLEDDAARLLARLRETSAAPETAPVLGDPFARGATATGSRDELDRIYGPDFGAAASDAPVGTWSGPLRSSYGIHLVWVHERLPGRVPPLTAVRNQVVHRLLRERSEARLARSLEALRARYAITVEPATGAAGARGVRG